MKELVEMPVVANLTAEAWHRIPDSQGMMAKHDFEMKLHRVGEKRGFTEYLYAYRKAVTRRCHRAGNLAREHGCKHRPEATLVKELPSCAQNLGMGREDGLIPRVRGRYGDMLCMVPPSARRGYP
jgi:hypothetical protein